MRKIQDTPKVDFGAHFYPDIPEELIGKHDAIERYDGNPVCTDPDTIVERYAAAGIDHIVLSMPYYMGIGDAEAVRVANDDLLDVVNAYEEFYGLAAIPVAAGGEEAAAEFQRALDAGFHGGALETTTDDGTELVDEALEPVFEIADKTGAPILVHPNVSFQEDRTDVDETEDGYEDDEPEDTYKLNSIFGTENALARSMCKVVHEGVFDQYPGLNLVYHHNGGNVASMLSRIQLWLDRVHRDGGEHLKTSEEFVRQVEERVYVDTAGYYGDPGPFRETFEVFPTSQVMLATDFPYETLAPETFRKIMGAVDGLRPGSETEAVLGGNALELLLDD